MTQFRQQIVLKLTALSDLHATMRKRASDVRSVAKRTADRGVEEIH